MQQTKNVQISAHHLYASVLADYAVIIQAVIPAIGSSLPACPNY
ncbi:MULTISPECIES: hypothetical protein [Bacillus]|nr:hypothetical protein [Bacillus licheniformis]TWL12116.1 hypothetical protein CHCC19466_3070 [Bacillus licheniformis]WHF44376.1 hypothetical protein QKW34_18285 [Bacillus licheniformis]